MITHPNQGVTLFDTGYGRAFFEATAGFPELIYRWLTPVHYQEESALTRQLSARNHGLPTRVFLSHLHADHVAGLFDLPHNPALFASREAILGLKRGRLSSLLAGCPKKLRDRLRQRVITETEVFLPKDLSDHGLASFGLCYDFFGDGSAYVVSLPGHGIGQQGLFLPRTNQGPCFLVADAMWSLEALQANDPPPYFTLRQLGNATNYLKTFERLRNLHLERPEIKLIASHCRGSYPLSQSAS